MTDSLNHRIFEDMKSAMRAKDKNKLRTIRLIRAAIKQQEVDTRLQMTDKKIIVILDKMCKQRRDSIRQYDQAGRNDLSTIEKQELAIIQTYMPQPLSQIKIEALVRQAILANSATSMRDMGKVMAFIRPIVQGRADMGAISGLVRKQLSS